jgi:uncharacterized protein DUF6894
MRILGMATPASQSVRIHVRHLAIFSRLSNSGRAPWGVMRIATMVGEGRTGALNSFRVVTVSNLRDGDEIAVDEEGAEMANLHAVQTEAARSLVDMARHANWTKADGMFGRPMAVEVRDESTRPPGAAYRKKPAEHAGRSESTEPRPGHRLEESSRRTNKQVERLLKVFAGQRAKRDPVSGH